MTSVGTQQALADGEEHEPTLAAPVDGLIQLFAKAMRAHQLYLHLPNNPVYQKSIDQLRAAFGAVWNETDSLSLAVMETEFRWGGLAIAREPSKSESLAWLFYKDGVRELTFLPGFEAEELVRLMDLLLRARRATAEDDDLLTLLWEQDFLHLRYRFVDLSAEMVPAIEPSHAHAAPRQLEVGDVAAADESAAAGASAEFVRMQDLDATLYFLDEAEIEYLRAAIEAEYREDLRRNVLSILLDVYEQEALDSVRTEITEVCQQFVLHLLAVGDFRTVGFLVHEVLVAADRARSQEPAQRVRLLGVVRRLSAPEVLGQLLQTIEDAAQPPPSEELDALFDVLGAAALETLLGWLVRAQGGPVRAALERAAARIAAANVGELVRLIGSADSQIAVQAVRRAGDLKTPGAVAPLGKLLGSPEVSLRLAAVQALAEIGSAGALQQLERAVEDSGRNIRITAVRVLGARGHRAALPKVEAAIKGKALREADLTEKLIYFEAYGLLAGGGGVAQLDGLLNARGIFGRREDGETRACAALALGKIGTSEAQEALRRASDDKDVVVRNAVTKALRGAAA